MDADRREGSPEALARSFGGSSCMGGAMSRDANDPRPPRRARPPVVPDPDSPTRPKSKPRLPASDVPPADHYDFEAEPQPETTSTFRPNPGRVKEPRTTED